MEPTFDGEELRSCKLHCLELMYKLDSDPVLDDLHTDMKNLFSSFLRMEKKVNCEFAVVQSLSLERKEGVRAIFKNCVSCLDELRTVCSLYKMCTPRGWTLNGQDSGRALLLDCLTNPLDGIGNILSYLAHILPVWLDEDSAGQQRPDAWADWTKSASDNVLELQHRISIAKEVINLNLSANKLHQRLKHLTTAPLTDRADLSCSSETESIRRLEGNGVWVRLREDLVTEGIPNQAIEKIEDSLKDCVRNLVQGKTPRWEPLDHGITSDSPKPEISALGEACGDFFASGELLDWEEVDKKVTAAFGRLSPNNFISVAPEIVRIALQSERENNARTFRTVLRKMYDLACHDPARATTHARFAKYLQKHSTPDIHKKMSTRGSLFGAKHGGDQQPVTNYLLNRCWEAWNHGKNGRAQISAEHFALGLPCFIGELAKNKMFDAQHITMFLHKLLEPDPPVGTTQFVALYHLLRSVGSNIERGKKTSRDMRIYFQRIDAIISSEGTPSQVITLGQQLKEMRRRGWKGRAELKALGQAVEAVAGTKDKCSRMKSSLSST